MQVRWIVDTKLSKECVDFLRDEITHTWAVVHTDTKIGQHTETSADCVDDENYIARTVRAEQNMDKGKYTFGFSTAMDWPSIQGFFFFFQTLAQDVGIDPTLHRTSGVFLWTIICQ